MSEDSTIVNDAKSTHVVETFVLKEGVKRFNADSLSVFDVEGTDYKYVGRTDDWKDHIGKVVAWIPPDSIVDTKRPEFAFLEVEKRGSRIRAKKLRGIVSYGLLVLAPEGLKPGDNAAEALGVTHYDPETHQQSVKKDGVNLSGGDRSLITPAGSFPKYDVDAFMKYGRRMFTLGEPVFVTVKIHGENSKYVYQDGQFYCGSREMWKSEFTRPPTVTLEELTEKVGAERAQLIYDKAVNGHKPKRSKWWMLPDIHPGIRRLCEENNGYAIYGELYGGVGGFNYGLPQGEIRFAAFDILGDDKRWLDSEDLVLACKNYDIPMAPVLHSAMPFDFDKLVEMAQTLDGPSIFPGSKHVMEGLVVRPVKERHDPRLGRVVLKIINPAYLERN